MINLSKTLSYSSVSVCNIDDGTGLSSSVVTYCLSTSGEIPPGDVLTDDDGNPIVSNQGDPLTDGDWTTTLPTVPSGYFLWTRTVWTLTDGTFDMSYSVSYHGADGSDGTKVIPINTYVRNFTMAQWQTYGAKGNSVTWVTGNDYSNPDVNIGDIGIVTGNVTNAYDASGTQIQASIHGRVTAINGTNGTTSIVMTSLQLVMGATGDQGVSVTAVTPEYYYSTSSTSLVGGSWSEQKSEITADNLRYEWIRYRTDFSDSTSTYTSATCDVTISGVVFDVDRINGEITSKIWQSDIDSSISAYDTNTTTNIRDRVSEVEQDLDGLTSTVSDISTTVDNNNTTMVNRVSTLEQNVEGFQTTVSNTYATKSALDSKNVFILGTQTASTNAWTGGTTKLSSLTDGQEISYWLPYAPTSSSASLNLTLADNTETGAIPCYYSGTNRITNHYPAGNVIHLTYRTNVTIGSTTIAAGWWGDANYNVDTYDRTKYNGAVKAAQAVTSGNIIVGDASGYHHLKTGAAFDITYPILYAASAISSGSTNTNTYTMYPVAIATTQSISLTPYKSLYIQGTLSLNTFTPVSTAPITQTEPDSDDGYYYMFLGTAFSTSAFYLLPDHPIYTYKQGQGFANVATIAKTIAEQTADGFSWIVEDGSSASSVTYTSQALTAMANQIDLTGKVTFNSMESALQTRITDVESTAASAVVSVTVQYAQNTSQSTAPTSGWSTTAPTWEDGKYIWQRTVTVYGSGSTTTSNPTCLSGANGANGIGISSVVEQYYLSTSNTTQTGGSWSDTQPNWSSGKYIWTRSEITWSDTSVTYSDPVLANALNNANSLASTANSTAESAQSTANSASSTASEAITTAQSAASVADEANTTASTANTNATNALTGLKSWTGTCSTAASTVAKVVACSDFVLINGTTITVTFSTASTAAAPTLNVNSTGAKAIWFNGAAVSASNLFRWKAGSTVTFRYNGTYWVVAEFTNTDYFTGSVAAGTAAKTASGTGTFILYNGATITFYSTTANSASSPTLNVGSTGAYAIYYQNAAISSNNEYNWEAKTSLSMTFNGSYWYINDNGSMANLNTSKTYTDTAKSEAISTASADATSKADSALASAKSYAKNSVDWVSTNGTSVVTARDLMKTWTNDATLATTTINGGYIKTHTIEAEHLASDAIMSTNYVASSNSSSPYSAAGSFLDLSNGNFYTPNFGINNTTGTAYLNGEIIAVSGSIGDNSTNYWEIGNAQDYNMSDSAIINAHGTAYIQAGEWQISNTKINTQKYSETETAAGYLTYYKDTGTNTYYDVGQKIPTNFSGYSSTDGKAARFAKTWFYGRKYTGNSIPSVDSDWTYFFEVDTDGNIYENGTKLSDKYASIDGTTGVYLPLTGGTISGNLTVSGTLTATASAASSLTHSLSVNGKSFNGEESVTVGTIGVGYGGTGKTSWTQWGIVYASASSTLAQVAAGSSSNQGYLLTSGGAAAPTWTSPSSLTVGTATKATKDGSGNTITSTYMPLAGGTFTGAVTMNSTLSVTGNTTFNGSVTASTFTGNLSGNATTATTATKLGSSTVGSSVRPIYLSSGTATAGDYMMPIKYTDVDFSSTAPDPGIYYIAGTHPVTNVAEYGSVVNFGGISASKTYYNAQMIISGASGRFAPHVYVRRLTITPSWSDWSTLLDNNNYSTYTVTKTGTGASGTWGISITGSAGTVTERTLTVGMTGFAYDGSQDITWEKADISDDATASVNGWMSAADKKKLNGIESGAQVNTVTGVKGNSESSYRTGNINITKANIGLSSVTNNRQIVGLASGTTAGNLLAWGSDGYTVTDSGLSENNLLQNIAIDGDQLTVTKADGSSTTTTITITASQASGATVITDSSGNEISLGSATQPVYFSNGVPAIANSIPKLNNTTTGGAFYAPTSAGTSSYILKSSGSGAPSWVAQSTLSVGSASTADTADKLTTARNITIGNLTKSFDGSAAISFPTADVGIHYEDIMTPFVTKTYNNVICTADNDPNGYLYFFRIFPDSYYTQGTLIYKITQTVAGVAQGYCESLVEITCVRDTYIAYRVYNTITNTSYRPAYGHLFYSCTETGIGADYGHLIGERYQSSYNPATSANYRTVTIEILQAKNLTYEFFNSPIKYANVPGTGSTNYKTRTTFDGTTQGQTVMGDRNTNYYDRFLLGNYRPTAGTNGIKQYGLYMEDSSGTFQSLTTNYGNGTSKVRNTVGFKPTQLYYNYSSSNISSGNIVGNNSVHTSYPLDFRYSANITTTSLTQNQNVYLVGTMDSNGLFYIDETWWTQELPTSEDGKFYILVGPAYTGYQVDLLPENPIYWYKNGRVQEYHETAAYASVASDVDGTVTVPHGGTGATSFISGQLLIGNGTNAVGTRAITNVTTIGDLGWISTIGTTIPTLNTIAYWNGRYDDTNSNLAYCSKGAFGDAAIKGFTTSVTSGSANLITSGGVYTALGDYVTLATAQTISATKTFSAAQKFTNTTASTSMTTGSVTISGGLGVSGQVSANQVMIANAVSLVYDSSISALCFQFA